MLQRYRVEKAIDQVIGMRIFSICWLFAGLGCSFFQMLLLAQTWSLNQQAFVPACMASAWVLGAVVGMRLRADARFWGSCLVFCALLWLAGIRLLSAHISLLPFVAIHLTTLAMLALLLGAISIAWLSQRREWSPAGERVTLVRALVGTTAGLFVVWGLPSWAGLLGLICVTPLLAFDMRYANRAPQPEETRVVESWVSRHWRPDLKPLRLSTASMHKNWWWSYLVERTRDSKGYVLLTLLASSVAVIMGGVWAVVPTAFAGSLLESHALDKLGWLLAGQFIALIIGMCVQRASRGVVGFPDRLLPSFWQSRTYLLALLMLVVIGGSLVTLGLPFLQAPWWLAMSLASYTLAAAIWGVLLPRLRPNTGALVLAQRHLLSGQGRSLPDTLHMRYDRAQDERMSRFLMTSEGMLIACFIPLVGWLIDVYSSFDRVLVLVGLCFLLGLTLLALFFVLRSLKYAPHPQVARSTFKKRTTRSFQPGYSPVRLAW